MTNRNQPSDLGPIVPLQKRGHAVYLGLVDAGGIPLQGFDIDDPARFFPRLHFRIMRHGAFQAFVATKVPIEVRIMKDGKLISEQRLDPVPRPTPERGEKSAVRRQMLENVNQPQPFFIRSDNDGNPLMFTADPNRSAADRLQLQLHPGRLDPTAGPANNVVRAEPRGYLEGRLDIDLSKLPRPPQPPVTPAQTDASPEDGATNSGAPPEGNTLSDALTSTSEVSTESAPAITVTAPVPVPAAQMPVEDLEAKPAPDFHIDLPLPLMADSDGLVAIGVRLVQVHTEGEPASPPDGFDWVAFQMNTFEDSAQVRVHLHRLIALPAKVPYREIDDGSVTSNPTHTIHGSGCGCSHGHDPRRFK